MLNSLRTIYISTRIIEFSKLHPDSPEYERLFLMLLDIYESKSIEELDVIIEKLNKVEIP